MGLKVAAASTVAAIKQGSSDNEWDDMDKPSEESSIEDSSDTDEDAGKVESANEKRAKRLKTENEKFFEDL